MKVCIMAPDRVFLDIEAEEAILPTTTGLMGVLANHTPLVTAIDMGVMLLREGNDNWSAIALLRGFCFVQDNVVTILVNEAEFPSNIDEDEAQAAYIAAQAELEKAKSKKDIYLATVRCERARVRYQVTQQEKVQNKSI
jgi:F-type H+-transporting ATPase subunit epsilon